MLLHQCPRQSVDKHVRQSILPPTQQELANLSFKIKGGTYISHVLPLVFQGIEVEGLLQKQFGVIEFLRLVLRHSRQVIDRQRPNLLESFDLPDHFLFH